MATWLEDTYLWDSTDSCADEKRKNDIYYFSCADIKVLI